MNERGREERARDVILESISDGVFTVDERWEITSFNRAAERITGTAREQALGRRCSDVFRASICESGCALAHTIETGRPVVNQVVYIVSAEGERVPISVSTALLRNEDGEVIGGVETFRDLSVVEELRRELEGRYSFADIISKNHRMRQVFEIIPRIAATDSTVLVVGDSGTGKELVARAIHGMSRRAGGPLVVVNCGALPDTLLESELFGHKAGAFTGASADRAGRFAAAEGGTVFLDEIGDVSPALQVRLLRFLQERTYEPLGANEAVRADVRVVAATNRDLDELVEKGEFRRDLYYRIAVVKVALPPLKERRDDIPLLAEHFLARFSRLMEKHIETISPEAMRILLDHDYPGNVRELENAIEQAVILTRGAEVRGEHLPEGMRRGSPAQGAGQAHSLEELERDFLREALARNGGDRQATAKELGIHRTTLWRRMKRLGVSTESA